MKTKHRFIIVFMLCAVGFVGLTTLVKKQPAAAARVSQITNMVDIEPLVIPGPQTLVMFDIDGTLIWPDEPEAREEWFDAQEEAYKKIGLTRVEGEKRYIPVHLAAQVKTGVHLVDRNVLSLFTFLERSGVSVIALTARSAYDLECITKRQLASVGIDFSHGKTGKWATPISFTQFDDVRYAGGILYTGGDVDKGTVLKLFLKQLGYVPSEVIFVDNEINNLLDVAKVLKELKIKKYHPFYFTRMISPGPDKPVRYEQMSAAQHMRQVVQNG